MFDPDWTDAEAHVVTDFADAPQGGTHLVTVVTYARRAARDGAGASGMEHGLQGAYDRLDAIL